MKKIRNYINTHTVSSSFILYFVGYLFIGGIFISLFNKEYQIYARLFVTILIFFLIIRISKKEFNNIIDHINDVLGKGALSTSVITLTIFIINLLLTAASQLVFNISSSNNNLIIELLLEHPIIIGIITVLLTPFVEEIVFKTQLFKNTVFLKDKKIIKTIIIAIFFASLHCIVEIISLDYRVIFSFINYMIFYIITNIVYIKSNYNLMKPVAIHMLLNAISLILS